MGGLVSGGRYELLELHGGVAGQAFWRARDKRLGREVALTFVDPLPGEEPPGSATAVLDRTVALTGVYSDGLARVLDVIRGRAGGIVVSEWVPGRSLATAVADPDQDSAVAAVWSVADAAARAEQQGLVLGLDSPDRIRVTGDGRALLAFPGVTPSAETRGDVRGLGATLYGLLTGTWPVPLPDGSDGHTPVDGRPAPAPRGDDDEVPDPTRVRPGVPQDSAVLAMRSLDGSSVSSAVTVRSMISDRTGAPIRSAAPVAGAASASTAARAADSSSSSGRPPAGPPDDAVADSETGAVPEPYTPPDERTQKRRWQIMAGASAVAVVAVALLAVWMLGALSGDEEQTPLSQQLDAIERAAEQSRSADADTTETGTPDENGSAPAEPSETETASTPVEVSEVTAWQPASSPGVAENPASAANVADGDPSTDWSSDTYRAQVGDGPSAFKPGIGLMLELDGAQEPHTVVVHSEDEAVDFEVRASADASPDSLEDTTLLGEGTVRGGSGAATIDDPKESEYILVWITRLGTTGPEAYQADVSEVVLSR